MLITKARRFFWQRRIRIVFFPFYEGRRDEIFTFIYFHDHLNLIWFFFQFERLVSSQASFPTQVFPKNPKVCIMTPPVPSHFFKYKQIIFGLLVWNMCVRRGKLSCFNHLVCLIASAEHTTSINTGVCKMHLV